MLRKMTQKSQGGNVSNPSREALMGEAREYAMIMCIDELGREPNEEELEEQLEYLCDEYVWEWDSEDEEESND